MRTNRLYLLCVLLGLIFTLTIASPLAAKYREAPELAKLVNDGKLPSVAKRLPLRPLVSSPPEIGAYGGTITYNFGELDLPWNPYVPVSYCQAGARMGSSLAVVNLNDDTKLEPDLAEKWETSSDGTVITFYLRQGVKWSDGTPFTVDDILFTYYDVVLNEKMSGSYTTMVKAACTVGGQPVTMTKKNAYVFTVTMAKPDPLFVSRVFTPADASLVILPKHEMVLVHPKYNQKATANDWNAARTAKDKPAVLMPWAPSTVAGNKVILERNPYYWRVDRQGQQLPYMDTFVMRNNAGSSDAALAMISGELTGDFLCWYADVATTLKENEEKGGYTVQIFDVVRPQATLILNLDAKDESLRTVFRNKKFVDALYLLVNRSSIADKTGLLFQPQRTTIWPHTAKLAPDVAAKFVKKEDIKQGLKMLDELGITDKNGDGWREFPANTPNAGKPFEFVLTVSSQNTVRLQVAEEVKYQLDNLGLKVVLSTANNQVNKDRILTGEYDITVAWVLGPSGATEETMLVPDLIDSTGDWVLMQVKKDGRKPPYQPQTAGKDVFPWQAEWMHLIEDYTAGKIEKKAAFAKALEIVTPNLPSVPLVGMRFMNLIKDDIGNYPINYLPALRKSYWPLSQRDKFQIYVYVRFWDWYVRK